MARFIYIQTVLLLVLSGPTNAQQQCVKCPPAIDSICIGSRCAAVCAEGSCEPKLREICRLHSEQGISGQLHSLSPEVVNGTCLYKSQNKSEPIPFKVE